MLDKVFTPWRKLAEVTGDIDQSFPKVMLAGLLLLASGLFAAFVVVSTIIFLWNSVHWSVAVLAIMATIYTLYRWATNGR